MSKAAQLLNRTVEVKKEKKSESVCLEPSTMIEVGLETPVMPAAEVAKMFKELQSQIKALETEQDVLKSALRQAGQRLLDMNAEAGTYYASADVAGVRVSRANRFSPVVYGKDELVDAVGPVEYKILFNEKAVIEFVSIDELRQHVSMCKEAGITVDGRVNEVITANSSANEYICKIQNVIDTDRMALLKACLKDQAARVGGK